MKVLLKTGKKYVIIFKKGREKMSVILIAEDDREINHLLCEFLSTQGYMTISAQNGLEALSLIKERTDISLVLLDMVLPYRSGDAVLAEMRGFTDIPVIIVSARDAVRTKVDVMRMGADDYVTKPFDLDEMLARTEAVLRRYSRGTDSDDKKSGKIMYKSLVLDRVSGAVTVNGIPVVLTAKEYAILELMLLNPKKLFSKANLFESVWNEPYFSSDTTIKVHMSNLRSKLKEISPDEEYIETVWGMGYKLKE